MTKMNSLEEFSNDFRHAAQMRSALAMKLEDLKIETWKTEEKLTKAELDLKQKRNALLDFIVNQEQRKAKICESCGIAMKDLSNRVEHDERCTVR